MEAVRPDLISGGYLWDAMGRGFRQRDLTPRQVYDANYLAKYVAIDDAVRVLSAKRLRVLEAFVSRGPLLDFGCGTGRFVEAAKEVGWEAFGCDIIAGHLTPENAAEAYWHVVTFFDSLEHLPAPDAVICSLGAEWVMVSVPHCHYPDRPAWFMRWKHRRPGEHIWHWNRESLDALFALCGYAPVMHSCFEDEVRANPDQPEPNILTAIYRKSSMTMNS